MPWGIGSALLPFFFFSFLLLVCVWFIRPKAENVEKPAPSAPGFLLFPPLYQLYAPPSDRFIVSMYSIPIFIATGNAIPPVLLTSNHCWAHFALESRQVK